MRVLFLDDNDYRVHRFLSLYNLEGVLVDVALSADAVFNLSGPYDVVSLDHDLDHEHYEAYHRERIAGIAEYGVKPTGLMVAQFLAQQSWISNTRAIMHSFNNFGVERMASVLKPVALEVVVSPFDTSIYNETVGKWLSAR